MIQFERMDHPKYVVFAQYIKSYIVALFADVYWIGEIFYDSPHVCFYDGNVISDMLCQRKLEWA